MSAPQVTPDQRRAQRLATLFDLRMFIGSLFVVFGVIVTLDGVYADPPEIAKAAGINISLWTGIVLLVLGIGFVGWTLAAPPQLKSAHEATEADLPDQMRHGGHGH